MKTIIAGGRDYRMTQSDFDRLDGITGITEVVSGCARGVDSAGECWARHRLIPIKQFPADWDMYGRRAGRIRNLQMAKYADAVVLFPGGRGTEHMFIAAKQHGLQIYDYRDPNILF